MTVRLGLGIDNGGTFTDAVIVDLDTKKIISKAKSPTTYDDLSVGILGAVDGALSGCDVDRSLIKLVGISTTLATNSILQGKGGHVGLIGIGWRPDPEWDLGASKMRFIKGGCDSVGRVLQSIDESELDDAIEEVTKEVDAVVVSGMFSVCNGHQEIRVRDAVRKKAGLPVLMGQSFTSELGIYERTVTAVLNGKLLPIINDFFDGIESSMRAREITGRIFVFKGDGGMMSISHAREVPIEMVLSGPAASLMGGKVLSGLDECWVIDMGGTSTDIACLDGGFPRLNMEGAMVGNWRTRVKGIDIWTCGLGGDSIIRLDKDRGLVVGPEKVMPLAIASVRYPGFKAKLEASKDLEHYTPVKADISRLTEKERTVYDFVKGHAPCSWFDMIMGLEGKAMVTSTLLESMRLRGLLMRTGLTPTDALHFLGKFRSGDVEASRVGMSLMSERMSEDAETLAKMILKLMVTRVGEELLKKALVDSGSKLDGGGAFHKLLRGATGHESVGGYNIKMSPGRPIVGIGAPAKEFILPLRERIDGDVVVPEGHDVGNALGAVCSEVSEMFSAQVYARDDKYLVFSPMSSPSQYSRLEEAISSARAYTSSVVRDRIAKQDVEDVRIRVDVIEKKFPDGFGREMKFVNWVDVRALALARPRLR
ncbi:MAG: hydantoinase/oxoprolinase family protein [Methanomassiliicoccales archaeon]|nr:MAG: hydantoinase/oxoprolinase family protein [Methanomassiliicoccales archaeon]